MAQLILEASGIVKTYALRTVLQVDALEIFDKERIGLVGENGAGKSTLLGILSGQVAPDAGSVRAMTSVLWIQQTGQGEERPVTGKLRREFDAQENRENLSGGEKTRRRIAGALSGVGKLLLADEPTTDLDSQGILRLEKHLKEFPGAVVLVSHDRALLDNVCSCIWHLEDGRISVFPGNYSAYVDQRNRQREFQQFEYDQYRQEQDRLRKSIQQKVERASQVRLPKRMGNSEARLHKRSVSDSQSRHSAQRKVLESRLNMLEEKERPRDDPSIRMALGGSNPVPGKVVVEVRGLRLGFGERVLLENASMCVPTGSRTALLGPNGCGKSTLLSRILSGAPPVKVHPSARFGVFDQGSERLLDDGDSALESVCSGNADPSTARTVLARLGIRGDDAFKRVGVLSGGERAKVALARIMLSDANCLVLDEPTNHLDVFTMSALEDVLSDYAGTLLFVSHDRAFVERLADRLVFFQDARLVTFESTMAAYREKQEAAQTGQEAQLEITRLQIRMAALSARMDAPRKGDDPLALKEAYFALAAQISALRDGKF